MSIVSLISRSGKLIRALFGASRYAGAIANREETMVRRAGLAILSAVSFLAGTSCGAVGQYLVTGKKPSVRIVSVTPERYSLAGGTLEVGVEVENPYTSSLPVLEIDYTITSEGRRIVKGGTKASDRAAGASLSIPAKGKEIVPVRASIWFVETARVLREARPGSLIPYRAHVGISFDVPVVGEVRVPVGREGELAIPDVPKLSVAGITLDKVALDEVRATLRLEVENTSEFDIALSRFGYALSLGGAKVAQGEIGYKSALESEATVPIDIPLNFSPISIGVATFRLLKGDGADYRFEGDVVLETPLGRIATRLDKKGRAPLRSMEKDEDRPR